MNEIEVWIDLVIAPDEGYPETACVLFGRHEFPIRPLAGERLSFYPAKGASPSFQRCSSIGPALEHFVSVEVEEVSHYAVPLEGGELAYRTAIRCGEFSVPTVADARKVRDFMASVGFEVDPYGTNRLEAE